MNASTEKSFDSLNLESKLTTLTTYVQNHIIDCKIVLVAACKETNDHAVSNKAVTTIMENLPRMSKHTPKRQKTDPHVTPPSAGKKSTTHHPKARVLFNQGDRAWFKELLDNPSLDTDDEYNEEIHTDSKPAPDVFSNDINPNPGTMLLSTAKTYEKIGWDNNCNVINIRNPERNTNAIRCFQTVANLLKVKLPSNLIETIKNISNPDKFNFPKILDKLREHDINFTETNETFENIFSGQTPTGDMILVVSTHCLHDHKEGKDGNPKKGVYFMFSIVIPRPPYLVLPFSSTNKNCWLSKKCIQQKWGRENNKPKPFLTYTKDNMY